MRKKTPLQIAREIFPEVKRSKKSNDYLGYIIWNFTGYPSFWDTDDPEICFRRQLQEYHDDPKGVEKRQQDALDSMSKEQSE